MKTVLVMNQYALPRSQGGITRHADLFGRLEKWSPRFLVGNRLYSSQEKYVAPEQDFIQVRVARSSNKAVQRLLNWSTYSVQAVAKGIAQRNLDAVYASSPNLFVPLAGWAIARVRGVKYVLEVRDLWPDTAATSGWISTDSIPYKVMKAIEIFMVRQADHIVVVAEGWEDHFRGLGADMDNFDIIPNGADVSEFPELEERDALRKEFGFDKPVAVYAGAHSFANGLDNLLAMAKEVPEVHFLLVGAGNEKANLQQQAKDQGLANVEFREPLPKRDLFRILVACDVGVHCLRAYDALELGISPNKIFDYMGAGLPIVSNAGSSARRLVEADIECGYAVGEKEMVAPLTKILGLSEQERRDMGTRGRTAVAERFSIEASVNKIERVLTVLS